MLILFLQVVALLDDLVNLLLYLGLLFLVGLGLAPLLMQSCLEKLNLLGDFLLFAYDFLLPVLLVHVVLLGLTDLSLVCVLEVHVAYLSFGVFNGIHHFPGDLLFPHQVLLRLHYPRKQGCLIAAQRSLFLFLVLRRILALFECVDFLTSQGHYLFEDLV